MNWEWIRSSEELASAIDRVRQEGVAAIDTEFRRRDTFFPQVALMQMASSDRCWLIDPLTLADTDPLADLLRDTGVVKVLHSASEDLEVFERWLGCLPEPLFDTQRAAAMLNLGFGLSYRALVETLLSVELNKDETQSDWLARPLSEAQCEYAAQDVICLARCWPLLRDRARAANRFDWIIEDGAAMSTGGRGLLAKFRSAWKLKPPQLAVLLALLDWREQEARQRDKPRSWILSDKCVNELARQTPASLPQMAAIEGMSQGLLRRRGKELIQLITEARDSARDNPPAPLAGPARAPVKAMAKQLVSELDSLARELGMNPEILMPARDLELLAREATGESITEPAAWQGWRREAVIEPMRRRVQQLSGGAR